MKSIYFKNFLATAIMVLVSFLMIGLAFVFIGQGYVIKSHRDNMESNAMVVSRLTTTIANEEGLTGMPLRLKLRRRIRKRRLRRIPERNHDSQKQREKRNLPLLISQTPCRLFSNRKN